MPALAQDARYAYPDPLYANGDADGDGIPNADDPVDNRFDEAGNPVRFEVGETLPPESYGNATEVDAKQLRLHAAPAAMPAPPGQQRLSGRARQWPGHRRGLQPANTLRLIRHRAGVRAGFSCVRTPGQK
jgi:hypothetical protein